MYDYDTLDFYSFPPHHREHPERLRLQVYVDGRLVDSWTEPLEGSRWQSVADQFDAERRPVIAPRPVPPRHEQVLRWLDGVVGGRPALLALTGAPTPARPVPVLDDPEAEAAYGAVQQRLDRFAEEYLDPEAGRVVGHALALLWESAPHEVTGGRSAATLAGGLLWIVGKANGLFGGGLTQQLVQRELWLKQALHVPGRALARHVRGLDFHGEAVPRGCPDLMSFANPHLLTATSRRTLVEWRDLALAEAAAHPAEPES